MIISVGNEIVVSGTDAVVAAAAVGPGSTDGHRNERRQSGRQVCRPQRRSWFGDFRSEVDWIKTWQLQPLPIIHPLLLGLYDSSAFFHFIYYLHCGGYVLPCVCLSGFVQLLATSLKNYWLYLCENFTRDVSLDEEELVKFWKSFASGSGSGNFLLHFQCCEMGTFPHFVSYLWKNW